MVNNFPLEKRLASAVSSEWENLFPMKRISNGYSADYIKRQAKNIKKEFGITYTEALDKAAINAGFSGWRHFVNKTASVDSDRSSIISSRPLPPTPEIVSHKLFFSKKRFQRPNARLPLVSHQRLGEMLKILKRATEKNKRAYNQFADVAFQLDEWVQLEYKSREELSDDVFFKLYYGDLNIPIEYSPSRERIDELKNLSRKIKAILENGYHDCKPVRELVHRMDQGERWLESWPAGGREWDNQRRQKVIPAGSLVFLKRTKIPAILISHDAYSGGITCYSDRGPMINSRQSISLPKDQSAARNFRPQRLWLPYGKLTCPDGKQILFNRDYIPLWTMLPDGKVVQAPADTWVDEGEKEFFFNDGNAPWHSHKKTVSRCMDVLRDWGVENQTSELLALLPMAIAQGDVSLLQPKRVRSRTV